MSKYDIPDELLDDIEEYFNERADADQPAGCDCPIPNEEMVLLTRLQRVTKKRPEKKSECP